MELKKEGLRKNVAISDKAVKNQRGEIGYDVDVTVRWPGLAPKRQRRFYKGTEG